jgi:thiol-disulfide isomerase/thioredoxin
MRHGAILLAAVAAFAGCKSLDRDDRSGTPTGRAKEPGKRWLDGPTPGFDKARTPAADSWGDPNSPGFDLARDVRGILAGWVEDPDGRKVPDANIQIQPTPAVATPGAPVYVQTGKDGHFLIRGLRPRQAYQLTVRLTFDGKPFAAQVWAQTGQPRSQFLRLTLIEGLALPDGGATAADRPPPGGPTPLPTPTLPAPSPVAGDPPAAPDPGPPATTVRPDLQTEGPTGLPRPPAAAIPSGPPTVPALPPAKSQSKSVRVPADREFTLYDPTGEPRRFPSGRAGELVLLDFLTTRCLPCKQFAPAVIKLQAEYGLRGLEVVGVCCDAADEPRRRAVAGQYQRDERLNYLLYVEPGREPGAVMRRFGVEAYPTLVLLGATGDVLWKGHPKDADGLEQVIRAELRK